MEPFPSSVLSLHTIIYQASQTLSLYNTVAQELGSGLNWTKFPVCQDIKAIIFKTR